MRHEMGQLLLELPWKAANKSPNATEIS